MQKIFTIVLIFLIFVILMHLTIILRNSYVYYPAPDIHGKESEIVATGNNISQIVTTGNNAENFDYTRNLKAFLTAQSVERAKVKEYCTKAGKSGHGPPPQDLLFERYNDKISPFRLVDQNVGSRKI